MKAPDTRRQNLGRRGGQPSCLLRHYHLSFIQSSDVELYPVIYSSEVDKACQFSCSTFSRANIATLIKKSTVQYIELCQDFFSFSSRRAKMIKSNIPEFYKGRSVFITGATGFMGKVLVEKLLRSCPDVGHLYLLMRPAKGMDVAQRLQDLINNQVRIF